MPHSLTLTHVAVSPLPESTKPAPQVQVYPPEVSAQALTPPPPSVRPHCATVPHSLTLTHVAVSPEPEAMKPPPHAQVYPPEVSVQTLTPPPPRVRPHCAAVPTHSSTLTQVAVSPEPEATKPAVQEHV